MSPQFISPDAHSSSPTFSSSSSSFSSASERRLNALVRHLATEESSPMDSISASPTSAHADSVFAHVVRGPEDPILGVNTHFYSLISLRVFLSLAIEFLFFPNFLNVIFVFVVLNEQNKQVTVAYNKDQSPHKLNLGVGAYRTEVSLLFGLKLNCCCQDMYRVILYC